MDLKRSQRFHALLIVSVILLVGGVSMVSHAQQKKIEDVAITRAVENKLLRDDMISAHLLDVTTREGIVTFTGKVDNILARERAIRIAEAVKGVRAIVDRIEVKPVVRLDSAIKLDVETALLEDPVADSYELQVAVDDSVVTLKGEVESWVEEQLAVKIAKSIRGVRKVEDEIDIHYTAKRSDFEINQEIKKRMNLDPYLESDLLTVEVDDGVVRLDGSVGSLAEKSIAEIDSWVTGVSEVKVEDVAVDFWLGNEMRRKKKINIKGDDEIKRAVQDALFYDPRTLSFKIDVSVSNGIVSLYGTVDNLRAKKKAGINARNTLGVVTVRNYIKVRAAEEPSDEIVKDRVENAFGRDYLLNRFDFTINVRNQKVYLYGLVDNVYERRRAGMIAAGVPGVAEIANYVDIRPEKERSEDAVLKEDIEDELFWSVFVGSDDITVKVDDGAATLTGQVSDWQEYYAAVDNAFEAGAAAVVSKLKVQDGAEIIERFEDPVFYVY